MFALSIVVRLSARFVIMARCALRKWSSLECRRVAMDVGGSTCGICGDDIVDEVGVDSG